MAFKLYTTLRDYFYRRLASRQINNVRQFVKYGIVGFSNFVVGYLVYFLAFELDLHYMLALVIAHIISVFNSYIWNRFWTFRSKAKVPGELFKFLVVYFFGFLLNLVLLALLVEVWSVNPLLAQLFAIIIYIVVSFSGLKLWAFGSVKNEDN